MADSQTPIAPAAPAAAAPVATPAPAIDTLPLNEYIAARQAQVAPDTPAPPPPAPVQPETPEGDEGPEIEEPEPLPGDQSPIAKANRTRGKLQQRLDALTRERGDALSLYHGTLAKLEALQTEVAQLKAPPQQQAAPALTEPQLQAWLDAGKTYEQWVDARIEWRALQIAKETVVQEQRRAQQETQQRAQQEAVSSFPQRIEAAKAKYPDYETVVGQNTSVLLSPVMQDVAVRSPHGADIMYWLGTHPEDAQALSEMTLQYPPQAFPVIELLLKERAIGAGTRTTGAPAVAPTSTAPAPITPVGGGATTSATPLDQAPLGEFIRRRNAELDRKRGGGRS